MSVKVRKGVAYFATQAEAESFRLVWTAKDTRWHTYRSSSRVVGYQLGFAVQCKKGGDYFGPDGTPTMESTPRGKMYRNGRDTRAPFSLAQAQRWARQDGCTLRKIVETGEYRVNLLGGSEASAYYTTDLEDAVVTASRMGRKKESETLVATAELPDGCQIELHRGAFNTAMYSVRGGGKAGYINASTDEAARNKFNEMIGSLVKKNPASVRGVKSFKGSPKEFVQQYGRDVARRTTFRRFTPSSSTMDFDVRYTYYVHANESAAHQWAMKYDEGITGDMRYRVGIVLENPPKKRRAGIFDRPLAPEAQRTLARLDASAPEREARRIARTEELEAKRRRDIHQSQHDLATDRIKWLDREIARKRGDGEFRQNGPAKLKGAYGDWIRTLSTFERYRRGGTANVGNNTELRLAPRSGEGTPKDVQVVLHTTPIVTFHEDGTITLNSGGWHSTTTKARMNSVLPQFLGVIQKKRSWYVHDQRDGSEVPFFDGMRLRIE